LKTTRKQLLPIILRRRKQLIALFAMIFSAMSVGADVRLPAILADHMVLQQQAEISLWGWAYEGETVVIETSWGMRTQTVANARGEWRVKLRTPRAQSLDKGLHPEHITFAVPNENRVQIKDVLIGEVWLCSGQSNMTMMMGPDFPEGHNDWYGEKFWKEERAKTDRPALRLFNVEKTTSPLPQDDCKGVLPDHITLPLNAKGLTADLMTGWQACTPGTAQYFSAVAYYFGAMLQEKLNVPVGLVTSDVGGSPIEAWISLESIRTLPAHAQAITKVHRNGPSALFNGMIAPLTPMTIRGVIWYQGESNVGATAADYAALLKNLIADWRGRFDLGDLPFGIVQLANYGKPSGESKAALVREAQDAVASEVPGAGLAVAIDVGEVRIHPPNKKDVANRLALWARARIYGEENLIFQSPRYKTHIVEDKRIRVSFETGGSALQAVSGKTVDGFEVAGPDGKFVRASATIVGAHEVLVSSPEVAAPIAVRYAWANNPEGCNLYNAEGLPAVPFRTRTEEK
jgi:sialate O-acetylesterase